MNSSSSTAATAAETGNNDLTARVVLGVLIVLTIGVIGYLIWRKKRQNPGYHRVEQHYHHHEKERALFAVVMKEMETKNVCIDWTYDTKEEQICFSLAQLQVMDGFSDSVAVIWITPKTPVYRNNPCDWSNQGSCVKEPRAQLPYSNTRFTPRGANEWIAYTQPPMASDKDAEDDDGDEEESKFFIDARAVSYVKAAHPTHLPKKPSSSAVIAVSSPGSAVVVPIQPVAAAAAGPGAEMTSLVVQGSKAAAAVSV